MTNSSMIPEIIIGYTIFLTILRVILILSPDSWLSKPSKLGTYGKRLGAVIGLTYGALILYHLREFIQ